MPLVDKIVGDLPKTSGPVWRGPEVDGVTSSLIHKFMANPEHFRILAIEGLKPVDRFNKFLEFGNMWHVMEEALARSTSLVEGSIAQAQRDLVKYAEKLVLKYPFDREDVEKWYNVCRITFPAYVKFWMTHEDMVARTPLLSENVFEIPYTLPDGRVVKLKGKQDAVDAVAHGTESVKTGIWLHENKTKSEVIEAQLRRQLKFDLQTNIYLLALTRSTNEEFWQRAREALPGSGRRPPIVGVRYNVVRRPLGGGKGMIRPHAAKMDKRKGKEGCIREAAESMEAFYERLRTEYIEAEPETYFYRWNSEVHSRELERFQRRLLDPILTRLCDWYDHVTAAKKNGTSPFDGGIHYQRPYSKDDSTEYDLYMETGSTAGLTRVTDLFPELEASNAED